jgi:hypothetical protein
MNSQPKSDYLTEYESEMITALYRTIGYLNEQGTATPEVKKVLCNEITEIETKAKIRIEEEQDDSWLDFNSTMSPCHY